MSAVILAPLLLSLRVAVLATTLVFFGGVAFGWLMARKKIPGRDVLEAVFTLPLVLPPTVLGFGLLLLFGKYGPLGRILENVFHGQVLFTWWAAVIAASVVAFPLMYSNARAAFESVDLCQERAARTLGAGEVRVFLTVTMPLAWPGILSGVVLAFARALGEFGATLMVAGNIPGKTQTVPMAIYFAVDAGNNTVAVVLAASVALFSFGLIFWLNRLSRKRLRLYDEKRRG